MPSSPREGVAAPASLTKEREKSMVIATWSVCWPGGRIAGQRTIAGTRMPPSKVVPLRPDQGALRPLAVPPLSLAKMTTVSRFSPAFFKSLENAAHPQVHALDHRRVDERRRLALIRRGEESASGAAAESSGPW